MAAPEGFSDKGAITVSSWTTFTYRLLRYAYLCGR
jgi:hypothetical protein